MYALADCNNFFASCERVFQPHLEKTPIIVLSNNDGCVIARSQEAKDLGIKMCVPMFHIRGIVNQYKVKVFSNNAGLYGEMSNRVMSTISQFTPHYEVYSIDEMFIDLHGFEPQHDLIEYCKNIRYVVRRNTRVPISIGIAPTKTLAKIANKLVKKHFKDTGVCYLKTQEDVKDYLKDYDVGDVWGIGRKYNILLKRYGFSTGLKLMNAPDAWIKKNMGVIGLRLVNELRGIPCLDLDEIPGDKKNICVTRSFGNMIEDLPTLEESISTHANAASETLRKQNSCTSSISVFIHTNRYRSDLPQYFKSTEVRLPFPTSDTGTIIDAAMRGLRQIYKSGYKYKRSGIFINEITADNELQFNLFAEQDSEAKTKLNSTVDALNHKFGKGSLIYAVQGTKKEWKLRQENMSFNYTSNINEVPVINLNLA